MVVGQHEDAFTEVRGSDSGRAEQTPFCIEPQRGQPPENVSESGRKETWDVLQEDEGRSHLANHAGDVGPEPTVVRLRLARPGERDRLTRESGDDDVNAATPWASVEGGNVVPHRSRIQGRLLHPRHESGRGVSVPFNDTHGSVAPSGGEAEGEFKSANPGT